MAVSSSNVTVLGSITPMALVSLVPNSETKVLRDVQSAPYERPWVSTELVMPNFRLNSRNCFIVAGGGVRWRSGP